MLRSVRLESSPVPLELMGSVGPGPQNWYKSHKEMKEPLGSEERWVRRMVGKVDLIKCAREKSLRWPAFVAGNEGGDSLS